MEANKPMRGIQLADIELLAAVTFAACLHMGKNFIKHPFALFAGILAKKNMSLDSAQSVLHSPAGFNWKFVNQRTGCPSDVWCECQ